MLYASQIIIIMNFIVVPIDDIKGYKLVPLSAVPIKKSQKRFTPMKIHQVPLYWKYSTVLNAYRSHELKV